MVPNVVGSREGWELYIVTDGVMVLISTITPSVTIYSSNFSASHDIGHHLSMFISDSLMMAF
jgi:hypothetical protein